MNASPQSRYLAPTGMDRIFNSTVAALTRAGISIMGSRVLAVRGRKSGEWRTTPVNLLTVDGTRYGQCVLASPATQGGPSGPGAF